ncbi:DgyrCDS6436 [Dimorphilus gyrociliatus]|uniref:DgyrCDS6436 n=1 Tax=Dimorphilus gyrociliatus TaxID=2664684 RepID=A0A7I8VPL8_9ANNE|nr:DgyrCDS6436 [Dimorphilus gyrociliatus]
MSTVDFYYYPSSAPCRAILFTARAIDLNLNLKHVELFQAEHTKEDFIKLNPHQQVPLIVDNGFCLGESRAIQMYLFNRYSKPEHDDYYPKELTGRGKIDWLLYYDATTIWPAVQPYYASIMYKSRQPNQEEKEKLEKAFNDLDTIYFSKNVFLTGDKPTLADLSIAATITLLDVIQYDFSTYKGISRFLSNARKADWYQAGDNDYRKLIEEWQKGFREKGLID